MSQIKETTEIVRTETRNLPCKLTDGELRERSDELATTVQAVEGEKARQDSVKAELKAKMSELESRQTRLAQVVSRKEEYRDVKVSIELHANDLVKEVRQDTGELITVRPAKDFELQGTLKQILAGK